MPKYLSGRVKRTPQSKLTDDRYQYLDLGQAEPNIGDPPTAAGTPGIPAGQQYQLVSVLSHPGERYWIPIGGGLIPGAISIYDEGSLVSGVSSITQLNFVGNSLVADAAPYVAGVSAGNIATITAAPPGPDTSVLFKESGDFATSTDLVFNTAVGILTVGNGINIGIGGTIITARATTGITSVGIATDDPSQELDVNGDIRIRGTIYDFNNEGGDQGELLLKGLNGLEWTNQSAITAGAGGDIGQVQYHNTAGLVDGADLFYYDAVNDRVGIGSTQPAQLLDVLGVSTFIGGVTVDHLYITGVTTALNLINADGGIKANTAQVIDLTEDRVVYVGPNGELVDSSNLTFDDYTLGASGINVGGCTTTSQLEATGVSTLGNIQLSNNTIDTKLGNLNLNSAGGTVQVDAKIFLNNNTQSTTKSTGALTITGGVGILLDVNVGGAVSFRGEPTGVAVTLAAAGGITTTGGDLYVGGDLFIGNDTVFSDGKFEQLYVNPGIATFRGDVEFWSNADSDKIAYWDKSEDSLRFNDDAKIKLGNSDDLQLYHSSNINYIINGISDGELRIVNGIGPANIAKFINACSVDLYYDSANFPDAKLQTSGIGVTVNGQLDAGIGNFSGSLTVTSTSNLNGDVNLGNDLTDNIVFGGKVDSHILPNITETYNLGSGANRWDTVYAKTFDGLGTLTVEDLYVSGIATFKDDVEFHGTGGTDSKGNVGIKSAFWDKSEMRFRYLDNIEASWGDTRELQIYHFSDDDSYIKNTSVTGNLYVDSTNEFYIRTEGGAENAIKAKTNEGVDLYYDGGLRLSTYDKGIKLSANGTDGAAVSIYDGNNSNYAAIKSPNTLTADYTLTLPPDDGGPDNVLKTDGNGVLSWIAQGDLTAKPGGENKEVQYNDNGSFDGMESLLYEKTIGDITFIGDTKQAVWNKSDDALEFQDEASVRFGNSDDLQISHTNALSSQVDSNGDNIVDGRTSLIKENGPGGIVFKSNGADGPGAFQFFDENWRPLFKLHSGNNARAVLYHGGEQKLITDTGGISITGGIRDKDDQLGTSGQILSSTGTELDWMDASSIGAQPGGSDTQVQYNNNGSFGGMVNLTYIDSGTDSGNINILDSLNVTKVQWKATDDYGGANGLIEFKDDVKLRFGSNSQNIEIYHQQSGNTNYFDNNVKLNLRIKEQLNIQTTSGGNVIKAVEGDAVTLYYNSFDKLATTTDGIKITGGIRDKDDQLGTSGQILSSTGSQLDWINASSIVGAAGGDDTEIQFNNNGNLDGADYFKYTYNGQSVGDVIFFGEGGGTTDNVYWDHSAHTFTILNNCYLTIGTINDSTNDWGTRLYGDSAGGAIWDAGQGGGNITIQGKNDNSATASHKINLKPNVNKDSIVATANAEVSLWYNNTKRLETNNTGLFVYGDLNVLGGIVDTVGSVGTNTQVLTSTGARFKWVNSSDVGGGGTPAGPDHAIQFNDNGSFGGTAKFTYDGDDVYFIGSGANIWWNESDDAFKFEDTAAARFGTDNDLRIYHSSNVSYIDEVIGNDLYIQGKNDNTGSHKIWINANSSKSSIIATANASVELYDAGSNYHGKVLQTNSRGIGVYNTNTNIGGELSIFDAVGAGNAGQYVSLKSPNSLAASYTLTLPPDDGATNEVLTTDGNGVLSWTAKGTGGGGGLTNILVDYTGRGSSCTLPITISTPSAGTKQINIPDSSNAYGAKYVQSTEPTGTSVCDGDIWYDTSS